MDYKQLFDGIRHRTSMYLRSGSYDSITAFVSGCDAGNDFCLLLGFREWLIVRANGGNNLSWEGLALEIAFPGHPSPSTAPELSPENNRIAIDVLFDLLDEFFEARGPRHELAAIFRSYQEWLEKQDWYDPSRHGSGHRR